jgi:hypothetical protein
VPRVSDGGRVPPSRRTFLHDTCDEFGVADGEAASVELDVVRKRRNARYARRQAIYNPAILAGLGTPRDPHALVSMIIELGRMVNREPCSNACESAQSKQKRTL